MNVSTLRRGQYRRYVESLVPHFLRASQEDVKAAFDAKQTIDVVRAMRSKSSFKDGDGRMGYRIPNSFFFNRHNNIGLETLETEQEKMDLAMAWYNCRDLSKFSYKGKEGYEKGLVGSVFIFYVCVIFRSWPTWHDF